MAMKSTGIEIVGCGPGSTSCLTQEARTAVEEAEVLVGAPRLLDLFPDSAKLRIPVTANIIEALDEMALHAGQKRIVVLVTGDPGISSFAQPVVRRFGRGICRVIPGISSVQLAFARLALDWREARILSVHYESAQVDDLQVSQSTKIVVLTAGDKSRSWLVTFAQRLGDDYAVYIASNLSLPDENIVSVSHRELETVALPSLAIALFIHKKELV